MIEIKILEPVPSLNITKKEHWSKGMKRRKTCENQIALALLEKYTYKERQKALERVPRAVKIHSQRARLLDKDNMWGGGKNLLDAIRRVGLIIDDDDKWLLSLEYTQSTGKPHFTRITIQ